MAKQQHLPLCAVAVWHESTVIAIKSKRYVVIPQADARLLQGDRRGFTLRLEPPVALVQQFEAVIRQGQRTRSQPIAGRGEHRDQDERRHAAPVPSLHPVARSR